MNNELLTFTDSAARKVHELIVEEGNPKLKLRVSITGGGCSGFQYNFSFDEEKSDEDFEIKKSVNDANASATMAGEMGNSVTLLIDYLSMEYLKGAIIDYKEDIHGEQFVITANPNAKSTCGCGSSFTID